MQVSGADLRGIRVYLFLYVTQLYSEIGNIFFFVFHCVLPMGVHHTHSKTFTYHYGNLIYATDILFILVLLQLIIYQR